MKTTSEKIKELAAMYNIYGLDSGFTKMAEKELVNNNPKHICKAKELAAMARFVQ